MQLALGSLQAAFERRLESLGADRAARRLFERDPSLWSSEPALADPIRRRLGWLDCPGSMIGEVARLETIAAACRDRGIGRVLLLGMGGSSLCPEVLERTFGAAPGFPDLRVLDSTAPEAVRQAEHWVGEKGAAFVVASKSGTTIEVRSFQRYFAAQCGDARRFLAVTDPGTVLASEAETVGYGACLINDPDIGGRFSALSFFGLLPAALLGLDLTRLLDSAAAMQRACGPDTLLGDNPGFRLGVLLGEAALAGRDKLTLLASPEIASLGSWVEQLVAESTGKVGKGILPVVDEEVDQPGDYGSDRVFAVLTLEGRPNIGLESRAAELEAAGHPLARIALRDRYDLGGEFYRWEVATAVAGMILGIDPFDQPNVQESKDLTGALLTEYAERGQLPEPRPSLEGEGLRLYADAELHAESCEAGAAALLARHLERARPGDYAALLAYVPQDEENRELLAELRRRIGRRTGLATTAGFGPRFLHSTGQLHKGGPGTGLFLQITAEDADDLEIPGAGYGFATLCRAQALGDYQALERRGRRVLRCHLGTPAPEGLRALLELL